MHEPASPLTEVTADRALRIAAGTIAGFTLLALTNALAIALRVPMPAGGLSLRISHHAYDAALTLGLGGLSAALLGLGARSISLPRWAIAIAYGSTAAPIVLATIGGDLERQALVLFEGRAAGPIFVVYLVLSAMALPAAHGMGALFEDHARLALLPLGTAFAAMIANHLVLPDDYFGVHGVVAWVAATLAGATLAPWVEPWARALLARRNGPLAIYALSVFGALGLFLPPDNSTRCELFRDPASLAWVPAALIWPIPRPNVANATNFAGAATPGFAAWLGDRAALPPVPPTAPRAFPTNAIVVLITVDALRADVLEAPDSDARFPTFMAMKRGAAYFTHASAPGSQTTVSLGALFAGRTFSQMYWTMHGEGATRFAYAADDPSPRFPALLTKAGVTTVSYPSINFLAGEFGVARGFEEERVIAEGRRHAPATQVIDPLIERLARAGPGPVFAFVHLTEPHAPYDRGGIEGTERERYLAEVAVADAEIGRVRRLLKQRFPDRGVLSVASDHGEAFGEHQTFQHTKTLYEELLRVPLLVEGAGVRARRIEQRVGLVDVGPTVLDIFAQPVPSSFFGQSLVPLLTGKTALLDRPLIAEGRLRRALTMPDGLKVIDDPRRALVEVYDLVADPGETRNLWGRDPARAEPALAALRAFFAQNALRRPGYEAPYKP
ncbi:MAG: sulfatase-like hydrolase/transferase [Byssovorax sp.]